MAKFAIRTVLTGYKFDLNAPNGQTIATSEVYETAAACRRGIESVRKNAPKARQEDQTDDGCKTVTNPKFELFQDRNGQFRFRLKSRNGQIIASSGGYTTKAACENGIACVRSNAPNAEIES